MTGAPQPEFVGNRPCFFACMILAVCLETRWKSQLHSSPRPVFWERSQTPDLRNVRKQVVQGLPLPSHACKGTVGGAGGGGGRFFVRPTFCRGSRVLTRALE